MTFRAKILLSIVLLTICCSFSMAQKPFVPTEDDKEVPILQKFGIGHSGFFSCLDRGRDNRLVDEKELVKLSADKECAGLREFLKRNFKNESLFVFTVGGDCFVSGSAKVFRNDKTKKYTVSVREIYGGCRAAGTFQGWFTIEKIPAGYAVEYVHHNVDRIHYPNDAAEYLKDDYESFGFSLSTKKEPAPETLEAREVDVKGCIQSFRQNQFIIKDKETFLKTIRDDGGREWCEKNLEKIDFNKYSLLGIAARSDYCNRPPGLKYEVLKDAPNKQYLFNINYPDARGATCRRIGHFDVWLLVPKLADDFDVKFKVTIELSKK